MRAGGILEGAELDAYDWSLRLGSPQTIAHPPITLVTITDQDIRELGQWPVSDDVLSKALTGILAHGPRVVGVDIYRDLKVPPGRLVLNQVLKDNPSVLMVKKFGQPEQGGIPGPAILQGTDRLGFSDFVLDRDGVVRRGLLFLDDGSNVSQSLAFLATQKYVETEGIIPQPAREQAEWLQLGPTVFRPLEANDGGYVGADADGYQFLLDLRRQAEAFPTVSLATILEGNVAPGLIHDRIILLGVVSQGVKDYFYTSQCGRLALCPEVAGIELHALITAQLLREARGVGVPIATWSDGQELAWLVLWVFGGGLVGAWVRGGWRFSLVVIGGLVLLSVTVIGAMTKQWWIPWVPPTLGWLANAMVGAALVSYREQRDRQLLMALFSRHVSPQVAEAVWVQREEFLEKGRWRPRTLVVTTMFTDLEGFTAIAERLPSEQLWEWLNAYMDTMVNIITNHGGLVDDYYGDMIKAGFGALARDDDPAVIRHYATEAVKCSLAMDQAMRGLVQQWRQEGLAALRMRVGINTGQVMVGSLGSTDRLKFTTMGDAVNIAARLENIDKDEWKSEDSDHTCRILLGETTVQCLDPGLWNVKALGSMRLAGRTSSLAVYRLYPEYGENLNG